jgi:ankyrin repeat protein
MGQPSSKFDKLFTLICTHNVEELSRQFRSTSTVEQSAHLANLSDTVKGTTLLMYAAFFGDVAISRLLLDSGAILSSRDVEGRNALFYTVAGQAPNVTQYFLETAIGTLDDETKRNFINNKDQQGETCLHEAVRINTVPCVELLLKHDVDVTVMNNDGVTALHRAVDLGKTSD